MRPQRSLDDGPLLFCRQFLDHAPPQTRKDLEGPTLCASKTWPKATAPTAGKTSTANAG